VRKKRVLLVSAVAVLGVAGLFGHSGATSMSGVVLAPESDPPFWTALGWVGRLVTVYAHYPFETHTSDLIWEICAFSVALLGLGFRFYTAGLTAGGGRSIAGNRLDTTGPYSLVRHPLACANIVITTGLSMFPHGWVLPLVVMMIAVPYYRRRIRRDDAMLRAQFGADFERWAARVRALLPRPSGYVPPERPFEWRRLTRREYSLGAVILLVPMVIDVVEDFVQTMTLVIDPVWSIVAVFGVALLTGVEVTDLRATNPSGVVDRFRTRYTDFQEGKTLAAGILTDIERLLKGISASGSLDHIRNHIDVLGDVARAGQRATADHVLQIPARFGDYLVYHAHVDRMDLLGHLAVPVAALHARLKVLEEMQALQEGQKRRLEEARDTIDPNSLIVLYRQILEFTQQTVTQAQALVPQLRAFASRRRLSEWAPQANGFLFIGAHPRPRNVPALIALGRRIRESYKILAILVLNTLLIAAALELASRALTDLRGASRSANQSAPDPREKSSYYLGKTWAPQYWREFKLSRKTQYLSYVVWRRAPFTGATINIDDGGIRRTPGAVCGGGSYKVFVFGGSPIWGTGSPDWGTIPAYLQAALAKRESRPVCVVNFGESAYVSTQSVITLLTRLQAGDVPDLTLFYDGPNDVYAAFQSGRPTVHENVGSIAHMFERRGEAESNPLSELLDRSALFRVSRGLVNSLAQAPPPTLLTYETMGIDRTTLTEAVVRTYLDNYNVVDALAHKYGFKYAFFWPAYISAGKKHLTAEEEALKREVDPSLAKLYASVYHTMESRIPQHANLHSLSSVFDGHDSLIWIDDAHVTPVGNELIADGMLRAVGRREH